MLETNLPPRMFGRALSSTMRRDPLVRRCVKLTLDALAAALAMVIAAGLLRQGAVHLVSLAVFLALAMAVNLSFRFYAHHYRVLGIEEARSLLVGNLVLVAAAMGICLLRQNGWPGGEPPEVALGGSLLTGPLWLGLRMISVARHRSAEASRAAVQEHQPCQRTLIVGAGRAGMRLCQALREHSRQRCYQVLGFVDDALEKQGVMIHGVPVLGPTRLLPVYIREHRATQVILGMAGVPGARLRELAEMARPGRGGGQDRAGHPGSGGDRPWKPEVRDIAIEDLLRREPIEIWTRRHPSRPRWKARWCSSPAAAVPSAANCARRVVANFRPERLVLLGRGENSLWLSPAPAGQPVPRQQVMPSPSATSATPRGSTRCSRRTGRRW